MEKTQFDLTTNCDLECEFCYLELEPSELLPEQVKVITKQHPEATVNLGGGNPFLYPKLEEIVKDILGNGSRINLSTSASFIPDWSYKIDKKERIVVQVSLHASDRQRYEEICGKDVLDEVLYNAERLSHHYKAHIHSLIYKRNLDQVNGLIGISSSLHLPIYIDLVLPLGKGKNVELLEPDEINQLGNMLLPYVDLGNVHTSIINPECVCPVLATYYPFVPSLQNRRPARNGISLYINPHGEISKCVFGG